jgi:hypothetical protein
MRDWPFSIIGKKLKLTTTLVYMTVRLTARANYITNVSVRENIERGIAEDDLLRATSRGDLPGMRAAKIRGARNFSRCLDVALSKTHARRTLGKHILRRWDALKSIDNELAYFMYGVSRDCFDLRSRTWSALGRCGSNDTWRSRADHAWVCVLTPDQKSALLTEYHQWRRTALMQDYHERLVDIAIALEPLMCSGHLCIYVLLWILEWVWVSEGALGDVRPRANYLEVAGNPPLGELRRVRLLEGVRTSALRIK